MAGQERATYPQNYDVIVKWLADAMTGETLARDLAHGHYSGLRRRDARRESD